MKREDFSDLIDGIMKDKKEFKFQPFICFSKDGKYIEILLKECETYVESTSGDCGLIRDMETKEVVGALIPFYDFETEIIVASLDKIKIRVGKNIEITKIEKCNDE